MDRRAALERIVWIMGSTLSVSTASGVLGGCSAGPEGTVFVARTLTGDRLELVAVLAEHIVPATDTPGARDARVHEFIDNMLTDFYGQEEAKRFLAGLAALDARSVRSYEKTFLALDGTAQVALLRTLESEGAPFFATVKSLTLSGYYTSEIGATVELHIAPYGSYQADIPFAQVGRTWA